MRRYGLMLAVLCAGMVIATSGTAFAAGQEATSVSPAAQPPQGPVPCGYSVHDNGGIAPDSARYYNCDKAAVNVAVDKSVAPDTNVCVPAGQVESLGQAGNVPPGSVRGAHATGPC